MVPLPVFSYVSDEFLDRPTWKDAASLGPCLLLLILIKFHESCTSELFEEHCIGYKGRPPGAEAWYVACLSRKRMRKEPNMCGVVQWWYNRAALPLCNVTSVAEAVLPCTIERPLQILMRPARCHPYIFNTTQSVRCLVDVRSCGFPPNSGCVFTRSFSIQSAGR